MKKLAVFLSSGEPNFHIKSDLDQIANFLAEQKICLLYGGGKLGLMGYLGTKAGKRLINKIDFKLFQTVLKFLLSVLAILLILRAE